MQQPRLCVLISLMEPPMEGLAEMNLLDRFDSEDRREEITKVVSSVGNDQRFRSCRSLYKPRRVRSRGALLVLVLNTLVDIGFFGTLRLVFQKIFSQQLSLSPEGLVAFLYEVNVIAIPYMLYPVAGRLADVHYGRYKVIRASLWFIFAGFLVQFIAYAIHYNHSDGWYSQFVYYGVTPLVFTSISLGLAGFQANIIPFGLDQMPSGSGEEFSAFIHWYYWTRNLGIGIVLTVLVCTTSHDLIIVIQSAIELVCITVALLLCYFLKKSLVIEPPGNNPFKTVYRVLKFAYQHKSPINRSSLTYWEDKLPSRMDLGKSRYGGPFSTENVENVKTFLQIAGVLLFLWGFNLVYNMEASLFLEHLVKPSIGDGECTVGGLLLTQWNSVLITMCLPIYELLIYPWVHKYIPTTLKRIGIGMIVGLAVIGCLLAIDMYGHMHVHEIHKNATSNSSVATEEPQCFLGSGTPNLDVSTAAIVAPYTLLAVSEMLVYISALEFICAQAPYNMTGMLIGVYYGFRGLFALISGIIVLSFSFGFEHNPTFSPSCGILYYSFILFLASVGLVVFIVVAMRYKRRQRDEEDVLINQQAFVENYYCNSNFYGTVE